MSDPIVEDFLQKIKKLNLKDWIEPVISNSDDDTKALEWWINRRWIIVYLDEKDPFISRVYLSESEYQEDCLEFKLENPEQVFTQAWNWLKDE